MPAGHSNTEASERTTAKAVPPRKTQPRAVFTRREIADIAGVSLNAVDKAIEQGVLTRRRLGKETVIETDGLVTIALLREANVELPVKTKQLVKRWIAEKQPYAAKGDQTLELSDALMVRVTDLVRNLVAEAERYALDRDRFIESNPHVFGGQPVITGTRIPVGMIAKRLEDGDTIDVLREDYPHVDPRAFEVAARYAKTHPRRGRPAKPWLDGRGRRTSRA